MDFFCPSHKTMLWTQINDYNFISLDIIFLLWLPQKYLIALALMNPH